jgi:hypothetical protein
MKTTRIEHDGDTGLARAGPDPEGKTLEMAPQTGSGAPPDTDTRRRSNEGERRWTWLAIVAGVVVALFAALAVVLASDDDGDEVAVDEPTSAESETPAAPAPGPAGGSEPGATTTTPPAATIELTVYFLDDDVTVVPVTRTVPSTQAVARAAMNQLLAGPGPSDTGGSAIPAGTELLDITVAGGVATVNLSSDFGTGGGSASMGGRVAQIVYTLTEFDTVDAVMFLMEGEPVEALGGEGIPLAEPQTRADWTDFA